MRSRVLALIGVIGSLALPPTAAVAAPHIILSCPTEARGVVTHNGGANGSPPTRVAASPASASIRSVPSVH